jgi:hypothetical protein
MVKRHKPKFNRDAVANLALYLAVFVAKRERQKRAAWLKSQNRAAMIKV